MNTLKSSVTIRDIAREARVGVGTVSRVLNGGTHVSQSTFARVSAVIRRLGFRPNAQARRILRRRSEMVCFILSNRPFLHSFHAGILQGVEACASELKQHVVFAAVHCRRETPPDKIPLPSIILERGWTDGVILAGVVYSNLVRSIEALRIPFVAFGNNVFGLNGQRRFDQVCYEGIKGEFEATQYLISRGHRLIAFVADTSYPWFREQYQGYLRAMKANNLVPISLTPQREVGSVEYGEWAASQLVNGMPRPTAIVAGNDEIAYGLWRSFKRIGVTVPDEVSLVGFDDRELALLMDPALTTVRVAPEQIGKACMRLLLERLHHAGMAFTKRLVATKLVERESVRYL